ncbi:Hypothetical protein PHPALM_899 [Phytophthora palmivora]|uniref:PiggyBac transposable element-derived protein domain-containing protein n=1 Tax=Phytophthora palmivora TaxID=4796 RepID=A0A2P4YTN1_9STRA|nr:Hypothetical protein PHPALM_899 [Phytophthora palmivora]
MVMTAPKPIELEVSPCDKCIAVSIPKGPPAVSFDEAMLPFWSSFNRICVFVKVKSHKWEACSLLFADLRQTIAYGKHLKSRTLSRHSFLIKVHVSTTQCKWSIDGLQIRSCYSNRNHREDFGASGPCASAIRIIVIGRFYTSVPLALQMLVMGFYSIGTDQSDRIGLPAVLGGENKNDQKKKKLPKHRPASIERGAFEVTDHMYVPEFHSLRWWVNKAVYMPGSGGSVVLDRVVCRNRLTGEQAKVTCPLVLTDYQTLMGGVDIHDQLHLDR